LKKKYNILIGDRFERLVVLEKVKKDNLKNKAPYYKCLCDCGNLKVVSGYSLVYGSIKSCGCLRKEAIHNKLFKDLIGTHFGRLIVTKFSEFRGNKKKPYWECLCECGNIIITSSNSLIQGDSKSCGCLHSEIMSNRKFEDGLAAFNRLFRNYKNNIKRKKLPFELTKEYFREITQRNCFYCNRKPSQTVRSDNNSGDYTYNGIDRVDNKKGYTIENCVPCCEMCNKAKREIDVKDFYNWIDNIYNNLHKNILKDQ
jgi:hypothetical protein